MKAEVAENIEFQGRLAMYKPWGASTAVPIFNGQPNTIYMDASTPGVPGSEVLRVERAFFTWKKIGGTETYLSLGRRPSAGGPPLHYRQDEKRGGTPLGTIIDFQFTATIAHYLSGPAIGAQFALAYACIAQIGLYVGEGYGQLVWNLRDLIAGL